VEEERGEFLEVTILGPGCYSCNKLEQDVMAVLSETGIQANLIHITDPKLMAQYGIVITPALVINGKVKSKGTLPPKCQIKKWLEQKRG
jgi:small redox-active disulfide protein 2